MSVGVWVASGSWQRPKWAEMGLDLAQVNGTTDPPTKNRLSRDLRDSLIPSLVGPAGLEPATNGL